MALATPSTTLRRSSQKHVTKLILRSSLGVAIMLTVILIAHDLSTVGFVRLRVLVGFAVIAYLIAGEFLLRTARAFLVNWLVVALYGIVAHLTLFTWGINSPVGILSAGFVVILPSLLLGSRYILPVTLTSITLLFTTHIVHANRLIPEHSDTLSYPAEMWDIFTYSTIFSIFALVSWLSRRQIETTLQRAKEAESTIKRQKNSLRIDLERESLRLRELQMQEVQHLHKFAVIGQSTTATLHELANHLSVLNLDLDDLRQQSKHSLAIEKANESIRSMSQMVQAARRQLNNYDESATLRPLPILRQLVYDLAERCARKNVTLKHDFSQLKAPFVIAGDTQALQQVLSILATNAIDACSSFKHPEITISASSNASSLSITVTDNGMGVSKRLESKLFSPVSSTKPSGLGVGLYIARHITESHFNGSISFKNLAKGASFTITLPRYKKERNVQKL